MNLALLQNLAGTLNPAQYIAECGLDPFPWQAEALDPTITRMMILAARQSGKSTVIAGKAQHKAKYFPRSLELIICPAQDQSKTLMKKIEDFMVYDKNLPGLVHDAVFEKEFDNGSQLVALPGSERSVRGYSGPRMIIIDEAARVVDETYKAARPMMVGTETEMVLISTAFGKRGFFYHEWTNNPRWKKIIIRVAWDVKDGKLVPAIPEKEFKAYWKEKGVSAYYSIRHTKEFLQEELESIGEYWFKQEYCCEFLDPEDSLFNEALIDMAFQESVTPLIQEENYEEETVEVLEV